MEASRADDHWVLVTAASSRLYQGDLSSGHFVPILEPLTVELGAVYFQMEDWSVSPDGRYLAFKGMRHDARGTHRVCVVPASGPATAAVELAPYTQPDHSLAWSPESRRVAFDYSEPVQRDDGTLTRRWGLRVVGVSGEGEVTYWSTIDRPGGALAFFPDGRRLIYVRRQPRGEIIALDLGDGTQEHLRLPGLGLGAPSRITWLGDGRLAYDGLPGGDLAIARLGDADPQYVIECDAQGWTLTARPDGEAVVVQEKRPNVVPSPRSEYFVVRRDGSKIRLDLDSDWYRDFTWLPRPGLTNEAK